MNHKRCLPECFIKSDGGALPVPDGPKKRGRPAAYPHCALHGRVIYTWSDGTHTVAKKPKYGKVNRIAGRSQITTPNPEPESNKRKVETGDEGSQSSQPVPQTKKRKLEDEAGGSQRPEMSAPKSFMLVRRYRRDVEPKTSQDIPVDRPSWLGAEERPEWEANAVKASIEGLTVDVAEKMQVKKNQAILLNKLRALELDPELLESYKAENPHQFESAEEDEVVEEEEKGSLEDFRSGLERSDINKEIDPIFPVRQRQFSLLFEERNLTVMPVKLPEWLY